MNSPLLTGTLVAFGLICGALAGQSAERERAVKDAAAHAHDTVAVVGVQHCDDTVVGSLVFERGGAILPHLEPGQTDESVNKIMNAAPQHAVLRVCTEREQRWD